MFQRVVEVRVPDARGVIELPTPVSASTATTLCVTLLQQQPLFML